MGTFAGIRSARGQLDRWLEGVYDRDRKGRGPGRAEMGLIAERKISAGVAEAVRRLCVDVVLKRCLGGS